LFGQFLCLCQGENLEQFVKSAETSREDHQSLRQVGEPVLPHEEVVELEIELGSNVAIRKLLERQSDIETYRLSSGLACAQVGSLHDPGSAAGSDDEAMP